ncbi:flap endonuclease-1 [Candidatus Methanomassiliicoccus intestinalis]|uniref:flap endonuclease-1 n=1 Tax=Candidatus Methanomassiliicoccus intestinalis TaxID=1406512 RepID=UPI0037DD113B
MGVNISDIVPSEKMELPGLSGKTLAIDAYNSIYQFLSIIRSRDGTPLKDESGRVTSHLTGLLYRNINFLQNGIRPAYVFDGIPSGLKSQTLAERFERRNRAHEEWKKAIDEGDVERAKSKASQSTRISNEIVESSRILLTYLGLPIIQAPCEGEAQAAYMAMKGDVWAASSQDFDSLLFGAPRLVRNLNITGRRKMPGGREYKDIFIEEVELQRVLEENGLESREQLISLCILIGTDYNKGIRGIGPKKGLKLIRQYGTASAVLEAIGESIPRLQEVEEAFIHTAVTDEYSLEWKRPDTGRIIEFMCEEHGFSRKRVESSLNKLENKKRVKGDYKKPVPTKSQMSLDDWH